MDMASRLNTFQIRGRRGGSEDAAEKPKRRRAVATRGRPVASEAQACSDSNRRAQGIPHLVFQVSIGIKFRQEYRTKIPLALGARR